MKLPEGKILLPGVVSHAIAHLESECCLVPAVILSRIADPFPTNLCQISPMQTHWWKSRENQVSPLSLWRYPARANRAARYAEQDQDCPKDLEHSYHVKTSRGLAGHIFNKARKGF